MIEIPTFKSNSATLEQQLKTKGMLGIFSLDNSFETTYLLPLSHAASHKPFDDNLDDDFNASYWRINASEPKVLDDSTTLLSTLELLKELIKSVHWC